MKKKDALMNEAFALLCNHATVGLCLVDSNGRFQLLNKTACHMFGDSESNLLHKRLTDLAPEQDRAELSANLQQLDDNGRFQWVQSYIQADGTIVWLRTEMEFVPQETAPSGNGSSFIAITLHHATKPKTIDSALQDTDYLLRLLSDNVPGYLAYVSADDLRYIFVNKAFEIGFGRSRDQIIGQHILNIIGQANYEFALPYINTVRAGKPASYENVFNLEFGKRWIEVNYRPDFDEQGRVQAIIVLSYDVTERRQAQESLLQTETALRESNQQLAQTLAELQGTQQQLIRQERLAAVGQLAAGIAHDFNNILAVIILYAQLMSRTATLTEANRERLDTIIVQSSRAAHLIEQILDFSRKAMIERRPLSLRLFMKELERLLQRTLPETIRLILYYNNKDNYEIFADPTRIQQLFMNLAVNARDAMPTGGILRFALERLSIHTSTARPISEMQPGEWIMIQIQDSGNGIPTTAQKHVFEPFFTTKAPGQGTGLGLAQAYGIVRQHEGYITFNSEEGFGTTFTIYLPALSTAMDEEPVIETAVPDGQHETILLVEDNPATCDTIQDVLTTLNYHTLIATNGQEALAMLAQQAAHINLVLSDVVMPELGGWALAAAIKQKYPDIPIVLMSGYALDSPPPGMSLEHTTWLRKPFSIQELANVLQEQLAT
ncbi:MAG: PAS domain-containing protein [Chloroflexota bacterium]